MNSLVKNIYDKCYKNGFQSYCEKIASFEKTALVPLRGIGSRLGSYGSSVKPYFSSQKPGVNVFTASKKYWKQPLGGSTQANPEKIISQSSSMIQNNKTMSTLKDNSFFRNTPAKSLS
jgi:hypothetical protein